MNICTCELDAINNFLCDYCVEQIKNENNTKTNVSNRNTVIKTTNDGIDVIQCEMCEKYVKTEFQGHDYPFADGGSEIEIIGGYGQFYDALSDDEIIKATLCHDCTLKLFRSIPKLKNLRGLHSVSYLSENYPLCCEYSWTIDQDSKKDEHGNHPIINGVPSDWNPQTTYEVNE